MTGALSYHWEFGDGVESTAAAPVHTFEGEGIYNISVVVSNTAGSKTSANRLFIPFAPGSGPAVIVSPPTGTAGITKVLLAGGFYHANQSVQVRLDDTPVATVVSDKTGSWLLNITRLLSPRVNNSVYSITTVPSAFSRTFTTLPGVAATPKSGNPGSSVSVMGYSYPPDATVLVFLAGVSVGQAQSDATGSFTSNFELPGTSPFSQAGSYSFSTFPDIQGEGANFRVLTTSGVGFLPVDNTYVLLTLAVLILFGGLIAVRRRRKPRIVSSRLK
ncbi:MAG: PKD domain-containing protein [archaeon]|nr:MAG: PKD domain-containing protein [archaeon]